MGSDAKTLLPQIKNLIENSGVFFEAKLRTVLEALDASPEAALQKVASDLKLLLGQLRQPASPSSPSTPPAAQTTQTASTPANLPVGTKADLDQTPVLAVATHRPQSETALNLPALQDGLPDRLAALHNLLELMQVSPERALQKLSNEVVALLQTSMPEQFFTPTSTNVLSPHTPADAAQDLDHKVRQLLEVVGSTPESESLKLPPELAALLVQTKEQATSACPTRPWHTASQPY